MGKDQACKTPSLDLSFLFSTTIVSLPAIQIQKFASLHSRAKYCRVSSVSLNNLKSSLKFPHLLCYGQTSKPQFKLSIRLPSFCHYSLLECFYRIIFSCARIFIAPLLTNTVFRTTRSTKLIQLMDVFLKTNTL